MGNKLARLPVPAPEIRLSFQTKLKSVEMAGPLSLPFAAPCLCSLSLKSFPSLFQQTGLWQHLPLRLCVLLGSGTAHTCSTPASPGGCTCTAHTPHPSSTKPPAHSLCPQHFPTGSGSLQGPASALGRRKARAWKGPAASLHRVGGRRVLLPPWLEQEADR